MEQTLHLRGVNFKVHWELVACDERHHAEWQGTRPGALARRDRVPPDRDDDGGTRFDYRNEFGRRSARSGAVASRALVGGLPAARGRRLAAAAQGARAETRLSNFPRTAAFDVKSGFWLCRRHDHG